MPNFDLKHKYTLSLIINNSKKEIIYIIIYIYIYLYILVIF